MADPAPCEACAFHRVLPLGQTSSAFCTRNPPTVEVVRSAEQFSLYAWYAPIPIVRCGEFKRRWWRWRKP